MDRDRATDRSPPREAGENRLISQSQDRTELGASSTVSASRLGLGRMTCHSLGA